ncbi:MAG: gliding motility-associated C-terminal domain-containing protein [Saprospiraceae bacterium]|nr:gliding motility-associated C-terminal domain-containing protein [Saprospiraceae bacterium]
MNGRYSYTDRTVERGKTYCYRIVGVFARRTPANVPFNLVESLASAEVCVQLQRDVPLITHATVDQTDPSVGRITVRWTKPNVNDLDTIQNPGPYRFVLERATGITRNNFQPIAGASFSSATFKGLNDTTWIDNNLNTVQNPYSYRVAFYIRRDSLLGYSQIASSHYLNIRSSDKLNELRVDKSVPWTNFKYDIFRSTNGINGVYDSIGTTTTEVYLDTNVVNKREYCYYVRAWGSYSFTGVPDSLINFSQRRCGTPIDTVPPCAPVLAVNNNCDSTGTVLEQNIINRLSWNLVTRCPGSKDAILYRIYYANTEGGNFQLIATINNILDTVYTHREAGSVAGCYYVTAVDSIGNESRRSNVICIDNCPVYKLPNAFTPNGDKQNDIFTPINSRYISKVEFKVVNRWGGLVFETTDPQLNWDGKNLSGNELAEGTYFYTCKVFEQRLSGEVMGTQILSGYIELFRGGN